MDVQMIVETLSMAGLSYALLDEEDKELRILISEDDMSLFQKTASKAGWKKVKDKSKDLYLYGMKHFLYYSLNDGLLVVCCQLGCRSTLNNGWVPLDRKINERALENFRLIEKVSYLGVEDELCYLAAKCIYTKKRFEKDDIKRIEACISKVDKEKLMPKLESIFFKFTDRLMHLITEKRYDEIIVSLWRYAEY